MKSNEVETAYRRGCHQTAAMIARESERMKTLGEAVGFLETLTDVLGKFRGDGKRHLALLDEAMEKMRSNYVAPARRKAVGGDKPTGNANGAKHLAHGATLCARCYPPGVSNDR